MQYLHHSIKDTAALVQIDQHDDVCGVAPLGALERLDVVAAPSTQSGSPLQAVLEALRATQAILEASQTARFGAKVRSHVDFVVPTCPEVQCFA